jgi:hypothetical protein
MTALTPSTIFPIVDEKPRREEWVDNHSLIRLMFSSMD